MELAVHIAPLGRELAAIHIYGEVNKLTDQLSRLSEAHGRVPPVLASVPRTPTREFKWSFLG